MDAGEPGSLPPLAHHGAIDYGELERLGLHPDEVIDFSVNSNPFGPSPAVLAALQSVPVDRYPDRDCTDLRRALSRRLGIPVPAIVAGNGTAELIWLVAFCFLRPGDRALILGPTFGEYERSARLTQASVAWVCAGPEAQFRPPLEAFEKQVAALQPGVVFVCNPNNPTGRWIDPDRVAHWARRYPAALFVVDEAYLQFIPTAVSVLALRLPNVLVLRSMTKDYALAGLRLGYAAGDEAVIARLARARVPWNVNGYAQAAGLAALDDEAYYRDSLLRLSAARDRFWQALSTLGHTPVDSDTHYFLLPVGDGAAFRQRLLARRILVRDCASFGLPGYVRVATRTPAQNDALCAALREIPEDAGSQ